MSNKAINGYILNLLEGNDDLRSKVSHTVDLFDQSFGGKRGFRVNRCKLIAVENAIHGFSLILSPELLNADWEYILSRVEDLNSKKGGKDGR